MIYKMKNGLQYEIREVEVNDAKELLRYVDIISGESNNLSFGKGEFVMTIDKEVEYLEGIVSDENQISFVAVYNDEIIGNTSYSGGGRIRTRHCGELGIAITKDYWSQGIGTNLMKELIAWAEQSKFCEKLNLRVNEGNSNAIYLYEKLGFVREGLLINNMKIDGKYINSVFMGKVIR